MAAPISGKVGNKFANASSVVLFFVLLCSVVLSCEPESAVCLFYFQPFAALNCKRVDLEETEIYLQQSLNLQNTP